jgi:lysozyme family protein
MSDLFLPFWPALHAKEGGDKYTNRAADRGGPTKHGVTAKKLGEWRKLNRPATPAEVQALTEREAYLIYRDDFFVKPGFDLVAQVSPRIAEELLDTGVNMGPHWPSYWVQRSLNLLNNRGQHYPDIKVDAKVGPATVRALRALIDRRGQRLAEDLMLKLLNSFQLQRYVDIIEGSGADGDQEENAVGWISQRVGIPV